MKKQLTLYLIFIVLLFVTVAFAANIAMKDGRVVKMIDANSCSITKTTVTKYDKGRLERERVLFVRDIVRTQSRIDEIDEILEVFK